MLQLILGLGILHDVTVIQTEEDGLAVVEHQRKDNLRRAKIKARQAQKRKRVADREAAEAQRLAEQAELKRAKMARKRHLAKKKAETERQAKLEAKRQAKKQKLNLERKQARRDRIELQKRLKAAEKKRRLEAQREAEAQRKAEAKRKAEAQRKAKMMRLKRQQEAKRRAAAKLEQKRRSAELARKAKLAEKKRLQKERQRARVQSERLARINAEKVAAAKRLKAERLAKMQAAKQKEVEKLEARERAEQRRAERIRRDRAQRRSEKPLATASANRADAKRQRMRDDLRRERQNGLRGWNPERHRRNLKGSKWHPRYWGAGVFYYNADTPNVTVIEPTTSIVDQSSPYTEPSQTVVQQTERAVDFRKSLSFGLRGGASTPDLNDGITSAGVGGAIGYRLFEPVGVEVSYIHQGDRIDISHDSPLQATGKLFLFPWSNVNPYVSGGINIAQTEDETLDYGAHGGMGIQFGTGKTAFNLEARYSGFDGLNQPNAMSAILGVDYHF